MESRTADQIFSYHEETKHHLHRYARSGGRLDWANQPDPFRTYQGSKRIDLPLLDKDPPGGHLDLYQRTTNRPCAFKLDTIGGWLELSLGLSAWKAFGDHRWSLRINPSSGNLHPTEAHLILPAMRQVESGVYHYQPFYHALELRMAPPSEWWSAIKTHFQTTGFFCGLTSIFWRESWKYGERAFRYCNHDVGHAAAALSMAANLFGWRVVILDTLSDADIAKLIGLDRIEWNLPETEHPDVLMLVFPTDQPPVSLGFPTALIDPLVHLPVFGRPNALSPRYINWDIIYSTADIARKPTTDETAALPGAPSRIDAHARPLSAARIIRNRRSATAYDLNAAIPKSHLISMLDRTIFRGDLSPFDLALPPPRIHLMLFVHQVTGLQSGIYLLLRNPEDRNALRAALRSDFQWEPAAENLPLFLLQPGDFRMAAIEISCHQEIAGFSAFSLGMLARFADTVRTKPYRYRHLFWEAGVIGQVLYLEAEAHGVRGTGIGCYFDDEFHKMLGISDNSWQSLYHFTVGHPIEDRRLTTLPPYHHLASADR